MSKRALLLIDLQVDFVEGGALAVPNGSEVIEVANRLIPCFDLVVATLDFHPADQFPEDPPAGGFDNIGLWCVRGWRCDRQIWHRFLADEKRANDPE